jgi:hypothetical protein
VLWRVVHPEEADEQAKDAAGISPPIRAGRPDGGQNDTEAYQQDRKAGPNLEHGELHSGDDDATACQSRGYGLTTAHGGDLQSVAMDSGLVRSTMAGPRVSRIGVDEAERDPDGWFMLTWELAGRRLACPAGQGGRWTVTGGGLTGACATFT